MKRPQMIKYRGAQYVLAGDPEEKGHKHDRKEAPEGMVPVENLLMESVDKASDAIDAAIRNHNEEVKHLLHKG